MQDARLEAGYFTGLGAETGRGHLDSDASSIGSGARAVSHEALASGRDRMACRAARLLVAVSGSADAVLPIVQANGSKVVLVVREAEIRVRAVSPTSNHCSDRLSVLAVATSLEGRRSAVFLTTGPRGSVLR